jgi:hypothetical protein
MKLSDRIKYIPITFAIIIVALMITMGILYIIGITPFKKNQTIGIILIVCGIFVGFYIGLCIGYLIVSFIRKYIIDEDSRLIISPISV